MIPTNVSFSIFRLSLIVVVGLFNWNPIQAQIDNQDNVIYIDNNGIFTIDTDIYYFGPDVVSTSRTPANYGIIAFNKGSWQGASDTNYIDGYAETLLSTVFTFPIGQSGIYAPLQVTPTSDVGVDAAYFRSDPATIGSIKNSTIRSLSPVEYWDIKTLDSSVGISLSWRPSSELTTWLGSSLNELTIVGWNGNSWVAIPSTVDEMSFLDEISTIAQGSIRSNSTINTAAFSAFSLGGSNTLGIPKLNPIHLTTFLNKSHFYIDSNSRIKAYEIYDIMGKVVVSEKLNGSMNCDTFFDHEEGIYIVKIEMENRAGIIVKKLINKK